MKKKLLSMLLISAMCLSTAGDTVLAASADFELDVQAENEDFLTGSVELTDGTDEDSEVSNPVLLMMEIPEKMPALAMGRIPALAMGKIRDRIRN